MPMCLAGLPGEDSSSATRLAARADAILGQLAQADASTLTVAEQAECLLRLEQVQARLTAARASVPTAFAAQGGYEADGQCSARTWLAWQTRITGPAAAAAVR